MSALPRRRKQRRKISVKKERPQNSNFLVVFLALIVLFETIIILSFITKKSPTQSEKKIATETKRVVSQASRTAPVIKAYRGSTIKPTIVPSKKKGKIAIVIDDWGYSKKNLNILKEINSPLTLAILPFQDYSRVVAEFGHKQNYEVIIHMPMEPENKASLEPKTLMVYMGRNTINSILDDAFENIKYARGINNHMGSRATKSKSFMRTVFRKLKKRGFYFLDSYVTADSVAYDISREAGVKFAKRSVFIDNESSPDYIKGQLNELAREADKNGKAVGVCHDRKSTLLTLKEEIPKLAKQGYNFVFVSELVK